MPIYGFESQDDFNRARDVIRTVEGQRVDLTRTKRARYPSVGSGGGGARPYVITATSGQETISAFTRADVIVGAKKARYENGVVEADPDADEQEIELFALGGVLFTGDVCFVSKTLGVDAWSGGTSAHTFMGKAVESMSAGEEGNVYLHDPNNAKVAAINTLDFAIDAGASCYVMFADHTTTFYIIAAGC